jgi:hypothetical protein
MKPCFEVYSPEYGFYSHVFPCNENSDPEEWNCRHLIDGWKWKTCESGGRSQYLKEYKEWQEGKGNRCPHCGIPINK